MLPTLKSFLTTKIREPLVCLIFILFCKWGTVSINGAPATWKGFRLSSPLVRCVGLAKGHIDTVKWPCAPAPLSVTWDVPRLLCLLVAGLPGPTALVASLLWRP